MSDQVVRVKIYQQKDYRFESEFGDRIPTIVGDEPQPLGTGLGVSGLGFYRKMSLVRFSQRASAMREPLRI